jgi:hypothetical protein
VHKHACVSYRFLEVDPAQRGRLKDMTKNIEERLGEAQEHNWLDGVSALQESHVHVSHRSDKAEGYVPALEPASSFV